MYISSVHPRKESQAMREIPVKDARQSFKTLLERVEAGEEVVLTRRGKPVARLLPAQGQVSRRLPLQADFRSAVAISGRALSHEVVAAREEERF